MIYFAEPLWLLLILPLGLTGWLFARVHLAALSWIETRVAPRRRHRLTRHRRRSLLAHLVLLALCALLLVAALARPQLPRGGEATVRDGRVLLLLDASASMYAQDAPPMLRGGEEEVISRFSAAQQIARLVVDRVPSRFLLASYSGQATMHLATTSDRPQVHRALVAAEPHTVYQNSGSSLSGALDLVLELAGEGAADLQVVLLGDGELPFEEDYGAPLEALVARGIPVHALTVGSEEGQGRVIYAMEDVVAGKPQEERRTLAEYFTRRDDRHFRRIAEATGGTFAVALETGAVDGLVQALESHRFDPTRALLGGVEIGEDVNEEAAAAAQEVPESRVPRDLAHWFVGGFLLLFLVDRVWLRRPPDAQELDGEGFDLSRIGAPHPGGGPRKGRSLAVLLGLLPALLPSLLVAGCGTPAQRAHQENELGILQDGLGVGEAARAHYRRSAAYDHRPEVPLYNLARSWSVDGEHSEAHRVYQEVLLRAPELWPAHYGDGVTLFRWGVEEEDPAGCRLEATVELWQAAEERFAAAAEGAAGQQLAADAEANRRFLQARLRELERLMANPPPECGGGGGSSAQEESPAPEEGSGSSGSGADPEPPPPPEDPEQDSEEGGSSPPPAQSGTEPSESGGSGGGLGSQELEQIQQALERVENSGAEEGKFHRRTREEQFSEDSWRHPTDEIWW